MDFSPISLLKITSLIVNKEELDKGLFLFI
jgi:hypothetical protein